MWAARGGHLAVLLMLYKAGASVHLADAVRAAGRIESVARFPEPSRPPLFFDVLISCL